MYKQSVYDNWRNGSLRGEPTKPLLILGHSGFGKTQLMKKVINDFNADPLNIDPLVNTTAKEFKFYLDRCINECKGLSVYSSKKNVLCFDDIDVLMKQSTGLFKVVIDFLKQVVKQKIICIITCSIDYLRGREFKRLCTTIQLRAPTPEMYERVAKEMIKEMNISWRPIILGIILSSLKPINYHHLKVSLAALSMVNIQSIRDAREKCEWIGKHDLNGTLFEIANEWFKNPDLTTDDHKSMFSSDSKFIPFMIFTNLPKFISKINKNKEQTKDLNVILQKTFELFLVAERITTEGPNTSMRRTLTSEYPYKLFHTKIKNNKLFIPSLNCEPSPILSKISTARQHEKKVLKAKLEAGYSGLTGRTWQTIAHDDPEFDNESKKLITKWIPKLK